MYRSKFTNRKCTISTSNQEEMLIANSQITGYVVTNAWGTYQIPISKFSAPYRVPMKNQNGELTWSTFWVRRFKI